MKNMAEIKKFSKAWLKQLVLEAEQSAFIDFEITCRKLIAELKSYIGHLDMVDSRRGKGTSVAKKKSSAENGKKGGWKKGVPRKKKEE